MDKQPHILATRLKKARLEQGIKQEQVARILQIPVSAVSAMERGKRKVDAQELFALAQLYQKPMEWFFTHHPEMVKLPPAALAPDDPVVIECFELLRRGSDLQRRHAVEKLRQWLQGGYTRSGQSKL